MNGTRKHSTCKHPAGCSRPLKSRDFCRTHWERLRKTGELGPAAITTPLPIGRKCRLDDCDHVLTGDSGKDLCGMHYQRWLRHGDPAVVAKGGASLSGATNPNWSGDDVTYYGAHLRIRATRGPASTHACKDCGGAAAHWSYNHQDPNERTDSKLGRYSGSPCFYEPRCVPCHSRFDREARALAHGSRP